MNAYDELRDFVLAGKAWGRSAAPYGLISVTGPDSVDFLQRLCSQDVRSMAPGEVLPTAFLDAKGKLVATCLALRDEDGIHLDVGADQLEGLYTLLDRYHFTEQLALEQREGACRDWFGGDAPADAPTPGRWQGTVADGVLLTVERAGVMVVRGHGADVPEAVELDAVRAEALRVLIGELRVGVDSEPRTLGPEAAWEDAIVISEAKGCYTGQEIVARIHNRGRVNRRLCLLHIEGSGDAALDTALHETEQGFPVGRVKSVVPLPDGAARVGLGYLPEDFWNGELPLTLGEGGPRVAVLPRP